jgi:hypothetical protein
MVEVSGTNLSGYRLVGVKAIANNDVWAIGHSTVYAKEPVAAHWDGSNWSTMFLPLPANADVSTVFMDGIDGVASNDMWAIGRYRANGQLGYQPFINHWDGRAWSLVTPGVLPPEENIAYLLSIDAISTNDVWAVGESYSSSTGRTRTLIEHWDGSSWKVVPQPTLLPGYQWTVLYEVSAADPEYIWAVGVQAKPYDGNYYPASVRYKDFCSTGAPIATRTPAETASFTPTKTATSISGNVPSSTPTSATGQTATSTPNLGAGTPSASPTACTIEFEDAPPGSTFSSFITCLACRNIISGYTCGAPGEPCPGSYFRPNNNVTRGQAAKIIANAAGYNEDIPSTRQSFVDVPRFSSFWEYIERVYARGAISGYGCGAEGEPCPGSYFRPGAKLTRGQLAKITSNVAGYRETPSGQTFQDVLASNPFYEFIERAVRHNVISGYACGGTNPDTGKAEPCPGAYFRPASNVTRGQTAKIVANTFFPSCQTPARR